MNNIFLTGPIRVGKSTALNKALARLAAEGVKLGGFKSYRGIESRDIFICPFTEECSYDDAHCIGRWDSEKEKMQPNLPVFEAMAEYLKNDFADAQLMVFDELGFLEGRAECFKEEVLRIIASAKPVTGILRLMDIPWQAPIYAEPGLEVLTVSLENRDEMPEILYHKLKKLL